MRFALVLEISDNPHFDKNKIFSEYSNTSSFDLVTMSEAGSIEAALVSFDHTVLRLDGPAGIMDHVDELQSPDTIVFNKSRGFVGLERKLVVPALCDFYGVPYIGSSGYVMTMARNKYHTNRFLLAIGIKVPSAFLIPYGDQFPGGLPGYPVIVKPNDEAGALGICEQSIVSGIPAIQNRTESLHDEFKQSVIIEEYISGEEFKVAVIGNGHDAKAVGCAGVLRNGKPIVGSLQTREDVLYDRLSYYVPDSTNLVENAMKIAVVVHRAIGCRDYSRIDFRVSEDGSTIICMEVSTQPDLGEHSSFISAAKQSLSTYENVIRAIYITALLRYNIDSQYW